MSANELEIAARWIVGLTRSEIPPDVLDLARAQRIDIVAAAAAGSRTAAGVTIGRAIAHWDVGDVMLPPLMRPRSVLGAAYELGALAGVLEYDSWIFGGHTGQAAVAASLAMGCDVRASGEEILIAQIAANEVGGRLGALMTTGPQHGHMKAYMHRVAAATASARLLRLDVERTCHALALALAQPEYGLFPGAFSSDEKALAYGDPIAAGVRAALLAREGLRGAPSLVEHPLGLIASLSDTPVRRGVWERLGQSYCLSAICFKSVAACAYANAATLAAVELREEIGSSLADRIARATVHTTALTVSMESFSREHEPGLITPTNTNFSTRRSVALALLAGRPDGDAFAAERFKELAPRIGELSRKVTLAHDWRMTVALMRGVDAAIDHPGRPGVYGMAESHRTMDRFREHLGSPPLVGLGDLPKLARLGRDGRYILSRYAKGYRARLPFFGGATAREAYVSRETDLRDLAFRFGARLEIELSDGKRAQREILLPRGFAGDPRRADVSREKFEREVPHVMTADRAGALLRVLSCPFPSAVEITASAERTTAEKAAENLS